nr:retrotransposon protein, putative, Ty1-copia subclass [Tanacetum cinerariifolium]
MTRAKFDIKKFNGTGDFGLWRIKMHALLIQHGCEAALEVTRFPREVTGETTAVGVWSKLETLYMTKSLANKLYLEKKLYTFYIPVGQKISKHIDEFNKIVLDLENTEEIKERSKAKGDNGEGLYVRGRTDHRDSRQSRGKSKSNSRGGRLKCYICQSEDHLKRNCPKNNRKKSTSYVKKDEKPSSSGSICDDSEVMMVMSAQAHALLDWIMDSGCLYHMTPRLDIFFDFLECDRGSVQLGENRECKIRGISKVRIQLKDGSSFVLHNVRYILELKRKSISLGTLKKEGYTIKLQLGKVKVINGSRVILSGIRKDNYVYSLDGHAMAGELNANVEEKDSLAQLCIESGIARHLTVSGTPQQNGVAERMNRTLIDKVHCLLIQSGLPKTFRVEATCTTAYLINRSPSRAIEKKTPMEMWSGHPSNYEMLRIFGSVAYPHDKQRDQATDQPPDLIDYQLVQDREPRTRMKPLRFRDESNMAAFAFMDSLRKNKTWELVDHPAGQKLRAVIDYNEVFSLVVRHTSIRVILALTAYKDYELKQLDVKTAFLHRNLEEVIYMKQPSGYEQGNKVCLLKKSHYGLKQSPRQWYKRFDDYMLNNGFKRSSYDSCVYCRSYAPGEYIYLLLYVDDMLIACKSKAEIGSTKSLLKNEFGMKELGEAKKILGMEIVRDRSRKILMVSQSGYVSNILNNFRIDNGKSVKMTLGGHFKLSLKDCPVRDCDVERMSKVPHENAVGSLMYLMVYTRPDIAYAVSVVSIYLANPDYTKDPDKGRSITGYAFLVHGCVVRWKATLQHVVALSTTETEYMALTEAVKEAIWLRELLEELGVELNTVAVNCDNQGAIHLSRNHVFMKGLSTSICLDEGGTWTQVTTLLGIAKCWCRLI